MRSTLGATLVLVLAAQLGCALIRPRCSEYRQVVAASHAELAAGERVRVGAAQAELPAVEVSEEAALLSKRLKTLCNLLWEEKISYPTYRHDVERAYRDYERTRGSGPPP